jgi:hypothetical protein
MRPCEPWVVRSPQEAQLLGMRRENQKRVAQYLTSENEGSKRAGLWRCSRLAVTDPAAMKTSPRRFWTALCLGLVGFTGAPGTPRAGAAADAPAPANAARDASPLGRIRDEGLNRSEITTTLLALTDLNGPRLTGSPGLRQASVWARDRLTAWGLANARLEAWGPFGRGWVLKRFSVQTLVPDAFPLIAHPKAWSPGVPGGTLESELVHVLITRTEDFEKYRGKLRGKIVLDGSITPMKVGFEPLAARKTDAQLLALANSDGLGSGLVRPGGPSPMADPARRAALTLTPQRYRFFAEEGVAALLQPSSKGEAGAFFVQGATVYGAPGTETPAPAAGEGAPDPARAPGSQPPRGISPWKTDCPPIIPQVVVAIEHYNRLARLAEAGRSPRVALELITEYLTEDLMSANVVAEIPGADRADEIVMLGAHLDSWHAGTGTSDNAAGCAVVLEAVRILQALKLEPRRTIRVALWSAEEQGLLGSKAYVAQNFGEPIAAAGSGSPTRAGPPPVGVKNRKPEYEKLSAYYNLDNGAGKIRGIYLQGNEAARVLFRDWLKPFRDLGADTVSLARTGSTDHVSFDAIGLPGFQFIQDDLEYWTRTWHGSMDVYDRTIADDLKQAAVVMAAVVYQTAMRDERLPRKPLTVPTGGGGPSGGGKKKGKGEAKAGS